MAGATAVNSRGRQGAWMRYALIVSLALHLGFAAVIYSIRAPDVLPAPIQRIIPVFLVPRQVQPPPPQLSPRDSGPPQENPGGRSGEGMNRPAIPVREPERPADPPPSPITPPTHTDPDAASVNASAGSGQVAGPGAAASPGPGAGQGQGTGPGVGDGKARGGPSAAPPGFRPQWRRLPNRDELDRFYPRGARNRGVEGGALLECTLGVTGRVFNCRVVRETPPGEGFGEAAVALSRYFRITPRREKGKAVETRMRIPYTMTLDAPPDAPTATGTKLDRDSVNRTGQVPATK